MSQKKLINNTSMVRETNLSLIRATLKENGHLTRTEVSFLTGLSIATCAKLLGKLIKAGEVIEDELEPSKGGRPARQYHYNKNSSLVACMCIISDGDKHAIKYAVSNLFGELLVEKTKYYPQIDKHSVLNLLDELIYDNRQIDMLGLGIPGIYIDNKIQLSDTAPLNGVPIINEVQKKYDIKVIVKNCPDLIAYGYYRNDSNLEDKTVTALFAPKGYLPGAGSIIRGSILNGDKSLAGEVGYIYYGFPHEELLPKMQDEKFLVEVFVKTVSALITTINPSVIVLTGEIFTDSIYNQVVQMCEKVIPKGFLPEFIYKEDYLYDYQNGLVQFTVDTHTKKLMLVEM